LAPKAVHEMTGRELVHEFEYGDQPKRELVALEVQRRQLESNELLARALAEVSRSSQALPPAVSGLPGSIDSVRSSIQALSERLNLSMRAATRLTTWYTIATVFLAVFALAELAMTIISLVAGGR